jgi:hypothetical protein
MAPRLPLPHRSVPHPHPHRPQRQRQNHHRPHAPVIARPGRRPAPPAPLARAHGHAARYAPSHPGLRPRHPHVQLRRRRPLPHLNWYRHCDQRTRRPPRRPPSRHLPADSSDRFRRLEAPARPRLSRDHGPPRPHRSRRSPHPHRPPNRIRPRPPRAPRLPLHHPQPQNSPPALSPGRSHTPQPTTSRPSPPDLLTISRTCRAGWQPAADC